MSGKKAKERRRQQRASGAAGPARPAITPMPAEESKALREWIDSLSADLGAQLAAILLGTLAGHGVSTLAGQGMDVGESVTLFLAPMLLEAGGYRGRRAVAELMAVSRDMTERPPGLPAHVPTWADTADLLLRALEADTRTADLFPVEQLAEYERPDGQRIQIVTAPRADDTLTVSLGGHQFRGHVDQAAAFLAFADECAAGTVPRWKEDGQPKCAVLVIAGDGVLSVTPTMGNNGMALHVRPPVVGPDEIGPVPDDEWFVLDPANAADAAERVRGALWWQGRG